MYKLIHANIINNKYVGKDCAQIMVSVCDSLSIFNNKGLTFYGRAYNENKIYKFDYINDERKKQFPYNETPYHLEKRGLFTNQLFDFENPQIVIQNNSLFQCDIINTNGKTYLIQTMQKPIKEDLNIKKYLNFRTVDAYFLKKLNLEDGMATYLIDSRGNHLDFNKLKPQPYGINNYYIPMNMIQSAHYYEYDTFNTEISKNVFLPPCNETLYLIKLNNDEIKIKKFSLKFLNNDIVEILGCDIPIIKHNLDEIKQILDNNIKEIDDPKFSKRLDKKNKFKIM